MASSSCRPVVQNLHALSHLPGLQQQISQCPIGIACVPSALQTLAEVIPGGGEIADLMVEKANVDVQKCLTDPALPAGPIDVASDAVVAGIPIACAELSDAQPVQCGSPGRLVIATQFCRRDGLCVFAHPGQRLGTQVVQP